MGPKQIRPLLLSSNLITLLIFSLDTLHEIIDKNEDLDDQSTTKILNACRLLTRILPYLHELAAGITEDSNLENIEAATRLHSLFWDSNARGARLVSDIGKLLFYRGFTVADVVSEAPGTHYVIWYAGVGSDVSPPETVAIINNRAEILRLLITLLSNQMYTPPESVLHFENRLVGLINFKVASSLCI